MQEKSRRISLRQTRMSTHYSHDDLMQFTKRNPGMFQRNIHDCRVRKGRTPPPREKTHNYRSASRQTLFKMPPVVHLGTSRVVKPRCFHPIARRVILHFPRAVLSPTRELGSSLAPPRKSAAFVKRKFKLRRVRP